MRIRSIRPEFWKDEDLAALDPMDRLLFIGLWNLSDGHGYLDDRPQRIRAELFPYQPDYDVDAGLDRLQASGVRRSDDLGIPVGFICRYEVDGKRCIWIPGFKANQRITGKEAEAESVFPKCSPDIIGETLVKHRGNTRETPVKQSGNNGETVIVQERKGVGKEGKGDPPYSPPLGDGESAKKPVKRKPKPKVDEVADNHLEVVEAFEFWKETLGHPRSVLPRPNSLVYRRTSEVIRHHGLNVVMSVIRGCHQDIKRWPDRAANDTLDIILRDNNIDRLAGLDPLDPGNAGRIATLSGQQQDPKDQYGKSYGSLRLLEGDANDE